MTKQKTHALPIMRSPTRLRQRAADINRLQPAPQQLLLAPVRHRVRHHHPRQQTRIHRLDGVARQNPVRHDGDDLLGAALVDQGLGGFGQGAAGVGHVVDEDGGLGGDGADEDHAGDFVGAGAFFVDEGEADVEAVGDRGRSC